MLLPMILQLILIATCTVDGGQYYTPPAGWHIEKVAFAGRDDHCNGAYCLTIPATVIDNNTVTLKRTVQVGETITAPEQCTLTTTPENKGSEPRRHQ